MFQELMAAYILLVEAMGKIRDETNIHVTNAQNSLRVIKDLALDMIADQQDLRVMLERYSEKCGKWSMSILDTNQVVFMRGMDDRVYIKLTWRGLTYDYYGIKDEDWLTVKEEIDRLMSL